MVDVQRLDPDHVSPTQAYGKMAFGQKSKSSEEVNMEMAYPKVTNGLTESEMESTSSQRPPSGSDKSSIGSLLDFSLIQRSELAVDQLLASRKKLEDEIQVSALFLCVGCGNCSLSQYLVKEISDYGEQMNCTDECAQVLQDR